jgi:hypothetical protein
MGDSNYLSLETILAVIAGAPSFAPFAKGGM